MSELSVERRSQVDVLVSIIVPVYNSEKYVRECVESILLQTYSNIEVILINDGSTDSSLAILKELESEKVKVVNTENRGVSEARNLGLELAIGSYVCFVDADDWISSDYVEYMLDLITKKNSDMALSRNHFTNSDKEQVGLDRIEEWSASYATEELLYPRLTVGCWNKIYSKALLTKYSIRFQPDLFFGEGLRFITDVSQRAKSIGVGERKVYWYRTNSDSCTSNHDVKKASASLDSLMSIEANLILKSEGVRIALKSHFWLNNFLAVRFLVSRPERNTHRAFYSQCKKYLRKNVMDIFRSRMPVSVKLAAMVIFFAPGFSGRVFNHLRNSR